MIRPGDSIPSVPVRIIDDKGTAETTSEAALAGARVVLFGVPGAFTPTCDTSHLPGFIANVGKFRAHGVERIVCVAANDHHVMKAWAERSDALGRIAFLADPHALLAEAMGLARDFPDLGRRYQRFAMIVEQGKVRDLFVQDVKGVTVSGAPAVLLALEVAGQPVEV
jgi:peroxiredoxin